MTIAAEARRKATTQCWSSTGIEESWTILPAERYRSTARLRSWRSDARRCRLPHAAVTGSKGAKITTEVGANPISP